MKKTVISGLILAISITLFSQINIREVLLEYYREPTMENFLKAYTYFTISAEKDSLPDRAIINLMNIHKSETDKHLGYLIERVDSLRVGMKLQVANILLSYGRVYEAVDIYEQINYTAPDWSRPWRKKAEAYLKIKEYKKAESALIKSLEGRSIHFDSYILLANTYLLQKKNKLALDNIKIALDLQIKNPEDKSDIYTQDEIDTLYNRILNVNKKL